MPLTVRLSPKSERALNALAKRRRLSRSDVVRDALTRYEADDGSGKPGSRPYDAWLDVIGAVSLGVVADAAGYDGVFLAAAVASLAGLFVLARMPRSAGVRPADAA